MFTALFASQCSLINNYVPRDIMICKGCGEDKKLIKAHAIPEAFFRGLRDDEDPPRLLTDKDGKFPKKAPIGVYDKTILCRDCEDRFQGVDDYAQNLLLKKECDHVELKKNGKVVGYRVDDVDYARLKCFFISVLWRASVSDQDFYSKVRLGPYESEVKRLIWDNECGRSDQYSFVVSRFTDTKIGRTILDPHRERWHGVNYYRLYLYGYVVYIKVDKRDSPTIMKHFEIQNDGPLFVVGRDIHNSSEYPVMVSIAKKSAK